MGYDEFVKAELLVLIPVLYAVGMILKKAKAFKDKYIPLVLSVVGVVLACLYMVGTEGFSTMSLFSGFIQGVICTAVSVYGNQVFKQLND